MADYRSHLDEAVVETAMSVSYNRGQIRQIAAAIGVNFSNPADRRTHFARSAAGIHLTEAGVYKLAHQQMAWRNEGLYHNAIDGIFGQGSQSAYMNSRDPDQLPAYSPRRHARPDDGVTSPLGSVEPAVKRDAETWARRSVLGSAEPTVIATVEAPRPASPLGPSEPVVKNTPAKWRPV